MTKTMIKKSLRAYISGGQLIFLILPDGKVARITGFQLIEHQVNGVFVFLVILPNFHTVYHLISAIAETIVAGFFNPTIPIITIRIGEIAINN